MTPSRLAVSTPVRVCDLGGWTDTWFAGHGRVMSLAVTPGVTVEVSAREARGRGRLVIDATDYGDRYPVEPGGVLPGRHPLLEAAVTELGIPGHLELEVGVHAAVPPGSSMGTSAAVVVAILAAMSHVTEAGLEPLEIARRAHLVETERLCLQSGVQDQYCAALGGALYLDVDYPHARPAEVSLSGAFRSRLENALVVVLPGREHASSAIHEAILAHLAEEGPGGAPLEFLRECAVAGRRALEDEDLAAYGRALVDNTEGQRRLGPNVVSADADTIIAAARRHGALGWKVNGAGGEGASVAVLADPSRGVDGLVAELSATHPHFTTLRPRVCTAGIEISIV